MLFIFATLWLGVPSVRVTNDLDVDVGLRSCVDWRAIDAGTTGSVSPSRPCVVAEFDGRLERYLGCLEFPAEAFQKGGAVALSSLDPNIPIDDCRVRDRYLEHSRLYRGISRVGDWVGR